MTIIDALKWANNKLKKAGVESPMLDAEILLAKTLGVKKSWLFSHFNDNLKFHLEEQFHILIERRTNREPVAYILGEKEFFSRTFLVNPFVLIPRPATETLVEKAINIIKSSNPDRTLITDIGTGSGAIAVTLAAETQQNIIAIDIDQQAITVAKQNAIRHHVDGQIEFQHGNLIEPIIRLFKTLYKTKHQDVSSIYPFETLIICANLPYLKNGDRDILQSEVQFEPQQALFSGSDGLDAYWELFKLLKTHRRILPRTIHIILEINADQTPPAEKLINHYFPTSEIEIFKDLQGNDRVIYSQC